MAVEKLFCMVEMKVEGVGMDKLPLQSNKFANLDSSGRLIHPSSPNRYTGILKKVVVLGPNTTGTVVKSYVRKTGLVAFWSAASYALFSYQKHERITSKYGYNFPTI